MTLQSKALQIPDNIFLGGHPNLFETAGRMQLIILLKEGIYPSSKVLDIGCGCLRGGYWLIHFLDPGCYFGIEPNEEMLDIGIQEFIEPDVFSHRQPKFSNTDEFDFSVFGETFDFFVARSIWSHAPKEQITKMLDSFLVSSHRQSVLLTSYLRAENPEDDYIGDAWVGRSHESDTSGVVRHSLDWIRDVCHKRDLVANEVTKKGYNFGRQVWLKITYKDAPKRDNIFRDKSVH